MKLTVKRLKIAAVLLLVLSLSLVVTVHFTDACRLETIRVDGEPLETWQGPYELLVSAPMVSQPVESLAVHLLAQDEIYRVDVDYRMPNVLEVRTNNFEPVCFVVGNETGKLFGLTADSRLVGVDDDVDWEQPVFTGLETGNLHSFVRDPRVAPTIAGLERLRRENPDLYRLVDEIDFSLNRGLRVMLAGLSYRLVVRPDRLVEDFERFVDFTRTYDVDMTQVSRMDLRHDDMIVCSEKN